MSGVQKKYTSPKPERSTPSKRRRVSAIEKAKIEYEELIKQIGGIVDVEGCRRTRSRVYLPKTTAAPPPAKKPKFSTTPSSRRGKSKKLNITDDEKNKEISEVSSKTKKNLKKEYIPEKDNEDVATSNKDLGKDDKSHDKIKEITPNKLNTSELVDTTEDVDQDQNKEDDAVETEIPQVENKKPINVSEIISAEISTDKSEEIEEKTNRLDETNVDPIVESPEENSETIPDSEDNIPENRSKTSVPEIYVDQVELMEVDGTKDAETQGNNVAQKTSEDDNKVLNQDLNSENRAEVNITENDNAITNASAIFTISVVNLDAPTGESRDGTLHPCAIM